MMLWIFCLLMGGAPSGEQGLHPAPVVSVSESTFLKGSGVPTPLPGGYQPPKYRPWTREERPDTPIFFQGASGFLGIVNTGWTPPDPILAAGPEHLVAMTNGAIAFFNKDGTRTFQQEISGAGGFWGGVGAGSFVFDPEVIFDPHSQRFFAMAAERTGGRSYFLLAVSDDPNPNGFWFKYRFDVTSLAGGDIDSPNIATDSQVVYLSADFFTGGQKYLLLMLRKSDLLTGGTPLQTSLLFTGTQSYGLPMTYDANAPAQYMIEHFEASNNTTVRLYAIRNPLTSPTYTTYTLTVPAYGPPEDAPQSGTTTRIETFDSRFWSCVYRNGSLWATHHINSSRVLARWYEIKMNGWPLSGQNPTLVQSGNIDPGSSIRTFFSSISVDAEGNSAVICARSSPNEFISIYRASRTPADPLGTMPDQSIVISSNGTYTASNRWGDYSGCAVDPSDGRTFWGHHEFAENNSWRTWIVPFRARMEDLSLWYYVVVRGALLSGSINELLFSDDQYMVLRPGIVINANEPPVQLQVSTTAVAPTATSLTCTVETRASLSNIQQNIFLYNFALNRYDLLDTQWARTTDTQVILSIPASQNPTQYINPSTNEIRLLLTWQSVGPVLNYPWFVFIDQVAWRQTW
jgi:hypothetical protein